jgi:hypothetical protein
MLLLLLLLLGAWAEATFCLSRGYTRPTVISDKGPIRRSKSRRSTIWGPGSRRSVVNFVRSEVPDFVDFAVGLSR